MQAFEYANPKTLDDAVKLLGADWNDAHVLAGGTDLLALLKDGIAAPKRLVSLKGIAELRGIEYSSSAGLRIGAMATLQELLDNADVRKSYPGLIQAAEGVSSPQIRSRGTVGGDLCQRPRCWYYRAGYGLLGQLNGKSLVSDGDNRYHAILGNAGPAYFVNPSSLAPILTALGARLGIHGPEGTREVGLVSFFNTPQSDHDHENDLKPKEILAQINVPPPGTSKMAVYEVRQKEALDWPLAAAAAVLDMQGDTVKAAGIVLGHVAPVPWQSSEAAQVILGKKVDEALAEEAGKAAVAQATPLSKNAYKVKLARVAVKRALLRAVEGGSAS